MILLVTLATKLTSRVDHPLASGFLLTVGCVPVTAPNVTPGDEYFVTRKSRSFHIGLRLTREEQ